ncbi:MAG: ankyrin repeat domain-containing protein [Coxiellaceae bacterium]|nr:ankyrin repeat domain-containing protein [Coxiellaceae bacterium]
MRPAEQTARITDKSVALARDGVHNTTRNAAIAKFLYEVFANDFGGTVVAPSPRREGVTLFARPVSGAAHGVAGRVETVCDDDESKHGSSMPPPDGKSTSIINIAEDSIDELFAEFRKLGPYESVIKYWQDKFKEGIQPALDSGVFYSKALEEKISVVMPIKDVVAAIATLVLDNENLYFRDAKDRSTRIQKLFNNMHSVSVENICHTGQRDAVLNAIDCVEFYCGDTKRSYRFPESLPAYMSSLQHTYIERYLDEKKQSNFNQYSQLMLTWCKDGLPETEIGQLADYIKKYDDDINQTLMTIGLCPSDREIGDLKKQYFREYLQYIDPILGENTYWHCVEEIQHMSEGSNESRNKYLHELKTAILKATKPSEVTQLEPQLKALLMIESSQRNIKRYRLALQYHLNEEGISIITTAQQAIADYYAIGSPAASLKDKTTRDLQTLHQAVSAFKSQGWVDGIENFFARLFPSPNMLYFSPAQARKLDSDFITDMTVDDAWLDHHFPSNRGTSVIEFSVYTANYFLIYLLTHSHKDWPARAPDILTDLIRYFDESLGVDEETEQEQLQHQALKESSYNAQFLCFLHVVSDIATGHTEHEKFNDQRFIFSYSMLAIYCNFHASFEMLWSYLDEDQQYKIIYDTENRRTQHTGDNPALLITTKYGYANTSQQLVSLLTPPFRDYTIERNLIEDTLRYAVRSNRIDIVKVFLDAENIPQELINTPTNIYSLLPDSLMNVTLLHMAAKLNLADMITLLLNHEKVDITAKAEYYEPRVGVRPINTLEIAIKYGSIATVNTLLSNDKIEVSIDDLHQAAKLGNIEIFKRVFSRFKMQHYEQRRIGFNSLTSAYFNLTTTAMENSHTDILKAILEYENERVIAQGSHPSWHVHHCPFRELNYAVKKRDIELVKLLFSYNHTFHRTLKQPELFGIAFVTAIKNGDTDIVNILMEQSDCYKKRGVLEWADESYKWGQPRYSMSSLLHVAAEHGRTDIVKLLLADGDYNVNHTDPDGWTALHIAAYYNQSKVAKLLLADGRINTGIRSERTRETALQIALNRGNSSVAFAISPIGCVFNCTIS